MLFLACNPGSAGALLPPNRIFFAGGSLAGLPACFEDLLCDLAGFQDVPVVSSTTCMGGADDGGVFGTPLYAALESEGGLAGGGEGDGDGKKRGSTGADFSCGAGVAEVRLCWRVVLGCDLCVVTCSLSVTGCESSE